MNRDLDDEIRAHLDLEIQQNIEAGMSPEEARYAALRAFGNVSLVKEVCREVWGSGTLDRLWQDLLYGLRTLRKSPGFTATAVLSLALGIGINSSVFTVAYEYLYPERPYKHAREVLEVEQRDPQGHRVRSVSVPDFLDLRAQSSVFEELAAARKSRFGLAGEGMLPEYVIGTEVTPNYFSCLGAAPVLGRDFRPEDEGVVILGDTLWRNRFAGDPGLIGKTITLTGRTFTVIGVMSPGLGGFRELFLPLRLDGGDRKKRDLSVISRLKPGITSERAQAEMQAVAGRLAQEHPDSNRGWAVRLVPHIPPAYEMIRRSDGDDRGAMLLLLLLAVGFVLLIACSNVANLLLVRGTVRQKEIALRCALGASRARLIRQLLTESLLMAILAGLAGLLLASWGAGLIARLWNIGSFHGVDAQAVVYTGLVSLATAVLFGLAPSWQTSKPHLQDFLKEGGRSSGPGRRSAHARSVLVTGEIALALVLLIGAGLMIRSFLFQASIHPGFNPHNLVAVRYHLVHPKYAADPRRKAQFFRQALQTIEALPGVEAAAWADALPAFNFPDTHRFRKPEDPEFSTYSEHPRVDHRAVSEGYLRALGVPLLRGRALTPADESRAVLINEPMARRFWPNEDPIGKQISVESGSSGWREIVGIVPATADEDITNMLHPRPEVMEWKAVPSDGPWVLVRAASTPAAIISDLRRAVAAVDKDTPVANIQTLEELIPENLGRRRSFAELLSVFALLAVVLALVGIYGIMSYLVTQRRHEVGVRLALGAQQGDVMRLMLGHGVKLAAVGVAAGLVVSWSMRRVIASFLWGVTPTDPSTFAGAGFLLMAVTLLASYIPARRAATVDPIIALRHE